MGFSIVFPFCCRRTVEMNSPVGPGAWHVALYPFVKQCGVLCKAVVMWL